MRFEPLSLDGAQRVIPVPAPDERGFFARTMCAREFADAGIQGQFVQSSISYNRWQGTFRGMHFQWPPSREGKLVRCLRGSVADVLLDLRPGSPSYLQHVTITLDDTARVAVYIPAGLAHGFQTLTDDAEVQYHMTDYFQPGLGDGFRWDDRAFGLSLPLPVSVISARDAGYPDFDRVAYEARYHAGGLERPAP